jgi:tRNA-dihydrouridine synthase A
VPPLNYERVYRLRETHPELQVIINGGITEIDHVDAVLPHVDGVMIGRQAYHHPWFLAELERHFDPAFEPPSRREVIEQMIPYIEQELADGERLGRITRHMVGLFAGMPGARAWRRYLSENAYREDAGTEVLFEALDAMPVAA